MSAVFRDVACRVARLLRRSLAHKDVDAERWHGALFGEFDHAPIRGKIFLTGVFDEDIFEPYGFEMGAGFGWRHQIGATAVIGPRNGMMRIADRSEAVLGKGEECAGFQHPVSLREELRAVGHVHRDVLGVGAIERVLGIRQVLPVSLLNSDLVVQTDQCRQLPGGLHKGRRNVDAGDAAIEAAREIACRATKTAANVQDVVRRLKGQLIGEVDRGGIAARMEMVNRGQVLYGQGLQRPTRLFSAERISA